MLNKVHKLSRTNIACWQTANEPKMGANAAYGDSSKWYSNRRVHPDAPVRSAASAVLKSFQRLVRLLDAHLQVAVAFSQGFADLGLSQKSGFRTTWNENRPTRGRFQLFPLFRKVDNFPFFQVILP
jgi:hypothetical protein